MDFSKIPLLSSLQARLDFLSARSSVIAQNIANADTPDYAAQDIAGAKFRALAESAALRVSDPRHLAPPASSHLSYRVVAAPDPDASLNGNAVSVETQAMKLSQTRQEYALATSIYRKGLAMLRLAARGQ